MQRNNKNKVSIKNADLFGEKMRRLKICFLLILFSTIFIFCTKTTKREKQLRKVEENDYVNTIETYSLNSEENEQWEYSKFENFVHFENDANDWEGDIKSVKKGNSLIWNNRFHKKRKCVIAIIDTGIDRSNELFKKYLWVNREEKNDNYDNDSNGLIDDINGFNFLNNNNNINSDNKIDHGTAIAGIICFNKLQNGAFEGNDYLSIMPLKIMESENDGKIQNLIKAIKYAESKKAQLCCISLVTYKYSKKLEEAIKNSKMLFIFSAGNFGINLDKKNFIRVLLSLKILLP